MKREWNKRNKEKGHRKTSVNTDVPDRNAFIRSFQTASKRNFMFVSLEPYGTRFRSLIRLITRSKNGHVLGHGTTRKLDHVV